MFTLQTDIWCEKIHNGLWRIHWDNRKLDVSSKAVAEKHVVDIIRHILLDVADGFLKGAYFECDYCDVPADIEEDGSEYLLSCPHCERADRVKLSSRMVMA